MLGTDITQKMYGRDVMTFDQWLCYGFYPLYMCIWIVENYLARENFCSNFILHGGLKHEARGERCKFLIYLFLNSIDSGIFARSLQYTSFSKDVQHQLQPFTLQ